jgi:hypothetical protein
MISQASLFIIFHPKIKKNTPSSYKITTFANSFRANDNNNKNHIK